MSEYTEAQIIKHALRHYIKRPGASQKNLAREMHVLQTYEEKVDCFKQKYNIKNKKGGTTK